MPTANPLNEHANAPPPGANWDAQRTEIKRRVLEVLGDFPESRPPLKVEVLGVEQGLGRPTYRREHVRFLSEEGDWIYAYVLAPLHLNGPVPAVICAHASTGGAGKQEVVGMAGSSPSTPPEPKYSYGLELAAEWGFVTLAPDIVGDGERLPRNEKPYDWTDFYRHHPQWSAVGKFIWDTSAAVVYLLSRRDVKKDSIGIIGHSMAAHVAMFSAAFDERIKACVCNGGTICWDEGEALHWSSMDLPDGRPGGYMPKARPFLLDKSITPPFSFLELGALIAPRPLMLTMTENGVCRQNLADYVMHLRSTYRALGANDALESGMYAGGHGFPPEFRMRAYQFLRHWLP